MFLPFFENLRKAGIPVSLREYLTFLEGMKKGLATYDVEAFYYLARVSMVKDERNIDKFDRAFAASFEGLGEISFDQVLEAVDIPADWLAKMAEKHLSDEEKAEIEARVAQIRTQIEETSPVRLGQPGAFALHECQGRTVIGRQNGRDHRIILLR